MNKCKCCGGDGFLESHDEDHGFVFSSCEPCNDSGYVLSDQENLKEIEPVKS